MKRSNLLKVLSVVMVVAMLTFSTTSAFAAVTAVPSATDTTVQISGTIAGAPAYTSELTVTVLKPGVTEADVKGMESGATAWSPDMFAGATSTIVNEDGAFDCTITLEDSARMVSGYYTVIVGPVNDGVPFADRSTTFYYTNSATKLEQLKEIIAETNASNLADKINDYKDTLLLDTDLWDQLAATPGLQEKAAAAISNDLANLRANISGVTMSNLNDVIKAIVDESYAQMVAGAIVPNIDDLGSYADIAAYKAALESDNIIPAVAAAIPGTLVGSGANSLKDLVDMYKGKVLLAGVVKPLADNTLVSRQYLNNFAGDLGLTNADKYAALSDMNQVSVADACRKSGATTIPELDAVFAAAVAALYVPVVTSNPGGGVSSGSGGSGGSGGGVTTLVTPTPTPTVIPTPSSLPINEIYNDIDNVPWAWEAISELTMRNMLAGYGDGSFGPNQVILREEFVKIAVIGLLGASAVDSNGVPSFTDAQSGWFVPYIATGETNNITQGIGDGLFGTGREITRQDMSLMLYRILRDANVDTDKTPYAFTDADQIDAYAADAVYVLKNMGIINGDPDGSFRPQGSTTRAEAAVLLYKTLDKLGKLIR